MPEFKAILFDLGGTLIYFDGEWSQVIAQGNAGLLRALQSAGLNLDHNRFRDQFTTRLQAYFAQRESEFVEYTTAYLLRSLLAEWGYSNVAETVIRQAIDALYAVSQACWKRERDTLPTLKALQKRGYRLGLISNAADDQDVQTLVDNAGIRSYFDVILTSASEGIRKPNPHIFKIALDHWGIDPVQAAMVGDTLGADILGAKNAGIYSIWITRRADTPDNRAHQETIFPDTSIAGLSELPGLLEMVER